jgi:CheY-like chemotaxis protein
MDRNGGRRRLRVAVVNDDTEFLALMEEVLTEHGYDVDLMRTLENTHERVRRSQPDVVICDIVVRLEERGWELVEMLTLDPKTRHIPLIVCSAAVGALEERRATLERQGIRAIAKPFDLEMLLATIEEAAGAERAREHM